MVIRDCALQCKAYSDEIVLLNNNYRGRHILLEAMDCHGSAVDTLTSASKTKTMLPLNSYKQGEVTLIDNQLQRKLTRSSASAHCPL